MAYNLRTSWFDEVNKMYKKILIESEKYDRGTIILDIDETILYNTNYPIPNSIEWVDALYKKFTIYIVSGRVNSESRLRDTIKDLMPYKYDKLILRPEGEVHKDFKLRIKTAVNPIFSVGDQIYDYPDYLIPNPFYRIDENGCEVDL